MTMRMPSMQTDLRCGTQHTHRAVQRRDGAGWNEQPLHQTGGRSCLKKMEQAQQAKGRRPAGKRETAREASRRENPRLGAARGKVKGKETEKGKGKDGKA